MVPKAFLEALAETFDEHGRAAVRHVRDKDPAEYARAFANIIPRDAARGDIYSDAQLERLCDALAARTHSPRGLPRQPGTGSRRFTR
jgi:hypothetical protein